MLTKHHLPWSSPLLVGLMISSGTGGIVIKRGDIEEQEEEEHVEEKEEEKQEAEEVDEKEETMSSVSISRRSHLFCTNDPSHTHTHAALIKHTHLERWST